MRREGGGGEGEVEEAGAVDAGFFAEVGDFEGVDDLLGKGAGVGAHLLGEDHGGVRLVVAVTGVGGEDNGGGEVVWHGDAGFFERGLQALGEEGTEHFDCGMRIWDCGLWRGNGGCRANEGWWGSNQ